MNWWLMAFRRFADFKGRSQRKEYWMFLLFNVIVALLLGLVAGIAGDDSGDGPPLLVVLYQLLVLVPSLAVGVRRLHDVGKSGWWLLLGFIPLVGSLILLYFAIQDSQPETNAYGPSPKAVS